jgi:hypothetical protein
MTLGYNAMWYWKKSIGVSEEPTAPLFKIKE